MPHLIDFSAYYQSSDFLMALDAITYRAGSLSVLSYSEEEGTLLNATNRSEIIASIQLNNGMNKSKEINQFLKDIDLYIDFCDSLTTQ
jgi:predicted glycosyltransferase